MNFLIFMIGLWFSPIWAGQKVTYGRVTHTIVTHDMVTNARVEHATVEYAQVHYGGSYGYGGYLGYWAGIRFNMDLIPKVEKVAVERGIVTIDGAEAGIVNGFNSWQNGHIPVRPGSHKISVELEDGRVFETTILAQPGQVIRVYLRFKKVDDSPPPSTKKK